jgi:thiol-disulfide isomerase/thioredoxin
MARCAWSLFCAGWLLLTGVAVATAEVPAGNYKFTLFVQGQTPTLWLLKLDNKDKAVVGEVVASRAQVPPAKITDLTVKDGMLKLSMELKTKGPQPVKVSFEGKVPTDPMAKKITGSFIQGSEILPAQLELTGLKSLDNFDILKETVAKPDAGPEIFDAALTLLSQAGAKKAKIEDVRGWASKASKAAEAHGTPWQREMALRMAEVLAESEEFAPVAVQYARQAERLLLPGDKYAMHQRTLSLLSTALTKSGKADEAKEITAKLEKLDPISVTKFAGRKGKSDRAVVVELFTGAECPPCVAADLAFDALGKTYKPGEVVLLQYHLHIPGPDPLTNHDTVARRGYYRDDIEGTPTIFFNGKVQDFTGGGYDEGQERYEEYTGGLNPLLEKPARVKLKATATQKANKINITAEASDLDEPSDKIRLRLALVEDVVNYKGGNKLAHHHSVVRVMPGGAAGLALKEKAGKQTATVDLDELKKKLTAYLDEATKDLGEFPNKERPMDLKKLRVIAFVQNDATKEILQAVQVDVIPE